MNIAIIDMGSNTIRLSIYKTDGAKSFENIMNKKEMIGLAGYIEDHKMSVAGVNIAIDTLLRFKEIADEFNISRVMVLATAPLRNIDNADDCIKAIEMAAGLKVDAVSGEKEAELDFDGAMLQSDVNDGLLVDIGGGSTEIVSFKDRKIVDALSLPIGSLSAYNRFFKTLEPSKKQINDLREYVESLFADIKLKQELKPKIVLGVGGSIRACNKLYMRMHNLKQNKILSIESIKEVGEVVKDMKGKNLDIVLKTCPDRIHTIIPGMIILKAALKRFDGKELLISTYGVREGYLNSCLH